jgi:hypothetical protein
MKYLFSFKRKKIRYEVLALMAHDNHVDRRLIEAQDDGWEICGDILLKNESGNCNHTFHHIPMRRRVY